MAAHTRRSRSALFFVAVALACGACDEGPRPAAEAAVHAEAPAPWPPRVGERYPDLHLLDQNGRRRALSSFEGHVLLVEMIGMTCPACQGFSGAGTRGTFGGVGSDGGLPAIDDLVARYAPGVAFPSEDLVFVQILLFNMRMEPATVDDARAWAAHFGRDAERHQYVLAGEAALHNGASYAMIPGFQLVDRDFVLRWDATGHTPRHGLYAELLPAIPALLEGGRDELALHRRP